MNGVIMVANLNRLRQQETSLFDAVLSGVLVPILNVSWQLGAAACETVARMSSETAAAT